MAITIDLIITLKIFYTANSLRHPCDHYDLNSLFSIKLYGLIIINSASYINKQLYLHTEIYLLILI